MAAGKQIEQQFSTGNDRNVFLEKPLTDIFLQPPPEQFFFMDAIRFEIDEQSRQELEEPNDLDVGIKDISLLEFVPKLQFDFKHYFIKSQKWIGQVIEIKERSFMAKLDDITNGGTHEIAEIDFDDISNEDKPLIKIGGMFYWTIGSETRKGQITRKSLIRFQRLAPKLTDDELNNIILDKFIDLQNSIDWD